MEDPKLCLMKDAVELITSLLAKHVLERADERMAAKHNRKCVGIQHPQRCYLCLFKLTNPHTQKQEDVLVTSCFILSAEAWF